MYAALLSCPGMCFALCIRSATSSGLRSQEMGQLIKVCTLILSFVLLWDYNFLYLKVEQYAKNSDPINKGDGTSQGTAGVQHEYQARSLLGGKAQKTSYIEKDSKLYR